MSTAATRRTPRQEGGREGWQLAGSSAEAYERHSVPSWSRALAEDLVELAEPRPNERVLDVACGTGIVARLAAERVGEGGTVCGLDVNEDMLDVARRAPAGASPSIEWRQGDVGELPLPDASFDLVTCQQGLQFFCDRGRALREMRRVLAPSGRLALSMLRPLAHHPVYAALADALERTVGTDAGAMMRSPFPESDAAELRELVSSAGLADVRIRLVVAVAGYPSPEELVIWEAAASPLAGPIGALGDDARDALLRDFMASPALRAYTDDAGVTFPQETYVALARRP